MAFRFFTLILVLQGITTCLTKYHPALPRMHSVELLLLARTPLAETIRAAASRRLCQRLEVFIVATMAALTWLAPFAKAPGICMPEKKYRAFKYIHFQTEDSGRLKQTRAKQLRIAV